MIQLIGEITTSPKTSTHGLNHGHYKQEEKESIVKIIKDEKERTAHHDCGGDVVVSQSEIITYFMNRIYSRQT